MSPRPRDVSLHDAYRIDFGARTEDVPLWTWATGGCRSVVEVGCGSGRIGRLLAAKGYAPQQWLGIDVSADALAEFSRSVDVGVALCGDAGNLVTWDRALRLLEGVRADVTIVPWSALFLIPHAKQGEVLRGALKVTRPGGRIVVECFIPQADLTTGGRLVRTGPCAAPEGDEPWRRRTTYEVDARARVTVARREYGPPIDGAGEHDIDVRWRLEETLYWSEPDELRLLAGRSGLVGRTWTGAPAPVGSVVLECAP